MEGLAKNAKIRIKQISVFVLYNTIWIILPIRYYTTCVVSTNHHVFTSVSHYLIIFRNDLSVSVFRRLPTATLTES